MLVQIWEEKEFFLTKSKMADLGAILDFEIALTFKPFNQSFLCLVCDFRPPKYNLTSSSFQKYQNGGMAAAILKISSHHNFYAIRPMFLKFGL
jgi:hypothetical protein